MARQEVGLDERTRVQEELQALPSGQLAPSVLALDGLRPASEPSLLLEFSELIDALMDRGSVRSRRSHFRLAHTGSGVDGSPRRAIGTGGWRAVRRLLGVRLAGLFLLAIFLDLSHGRSR